MAGNDTLLIGCIDLPYYIHTVQLKALVADLSL